MDINTLTELLRKEKRSPYLQKVDDDFYSKLGTYVREFYKKHPEYSKERRNIEKIIADLYNARERKTVLNALSFARFGKEPDTENLVPEEERTLEKIMETLRIQRAELLKFTSLKTAPKRTEREQTDEGRTEEPKEVEPKPQAIEEPATSKKESEKKHIKNSTIRILEGMPQIVGVDGKTYGSFKAEDVVTLPEANAKIFIKKGSAELIQTKD